MKTTILIIAVLLFVYGLHWIGQGTGWLPWPPNTIMDNNRAFTWYGLGLVVVAGLMFAYARRR